MTLSFTKSRLKKARLAEHRPDGLPLPGDILLFTDATGFSRLIPWFTGSRYYHVALYEGNGYVVEARPSGVVRRDIAHEEGNVFRVIPMPAAHATPALTYATACLGMPYDVLCVVSVVLHEYVPRFRFPYCNSERLMCAELVVRAWREAGVDLFPGCDAEQVIPADFQAHLPPDSRDMQLR